MANNLQPSQIVNKLGKYLYKHLDNAYNIEYTPNTCDVDTVVLYEVPRDIIRMYPEEFKEISDEVQEMKININLTTYADKIRMNLIVQDEYERTLGQRIYKCEKLANLPQAQETIIQDVIKILQKNFDKYEFIY